jgi:hypothetical protein
MPSKILANSVKNATVALFGPEIAIHNEIDLDDNVRKFIKMPKFKFYKARYVDFMNTFPCLLLYLVSSEDNAAEMYRFLNTIDNYQTDSFDDTDYQDKTEIYLDDIDPEKDISNYIIVDALKHLDFIASCKEDLDQYVSQLTIDQKERIGQIADNFYLFVKLLESNTALSYYMNMITPGYQEE